MWRIIPASLVSGQDRFYSKAGVRRYRTVRAESRPLSRLVFTGTGSSVGTPFPQCLLQPDLPRCHVSRLAMQGPPELNKNYRGNPSLLVSYRSHEDAAYEHIQIDCGKTYREALLRWYPRYNVSHIDAVILTHPHADAMLGLDELRTVQKIPPIVPGQNPRDIAGELPIYLTAPTATYVKQCFPHILASDVQTVARWTAKCQLHNIEFFKPFCVQGMEVMPVLLVHGEDCHCAGFLFGEQERVAYLSDVSRIPDETMAHLMERPIDLLVLDTLTEHFKHPTHINLQEALAICRKLKPKRTLLVGMSAREMEHEETNERLKQYLSEGLDIQLAYDGQEVLMRL